MDVLHRVSFDLGATLRQRDHVQQERDAHVNPLLTTTVDIPHAGLP
jgi:hypothetical protein